MPEALSLPRFLPEEALFLLISFEGPDVYSQAGGLGVRMAELSRALAEEGHETHLFFVGDPQAPAQERVLDRRLVYHRWCQWISRYHPLGVYDGEEGKLRNYQESLPPFLLENFFLGKETPGKIVVVLSEEWQTAGTVVALSRALLARPAQAPAIFLWNANNTFGFHRIDWPALQRAAVITTVSKYMKHLMQASGINPLVVPNGIPPRWFEPMEEAKARALRKAAGGSILLAKIGRFDPSKRWIMAIQAMALLKRLGFAPKLLMRGGMEPHGQEVRSTAWSYGLRITTIKLPRGSALEEFLKALEANAEAEIYDLQFFVPEEWLRLIYLTADAVLANSSHEPFGLVGLEVMACGGVAITGSSGEDYAQNFHNALVVESDDPWELAAYLAMLAQNPELGEGIRKAGQAGARAFLWPRVIDELRRKLAYVSLSRGIAASRV